MPANLYEPGDDYHPTKSHMLPALIRRFHEAAEANASSVICWGTCSPLREFLHVEDFGRACVFALEHWSPPPGELTCLNVCTGVDLSIRDLAESVTTAMGYKGAIEWDHNKPDGTPKKQLVVSCLATLSCRGRIPLTEGLTATVALFREELAQKLVRLCSGFIRRFSHPALNDCSGNWCCRFHRLSAQPPVARAGHPGGGL